MKTRIEELAELKNAAETFVVGTYGKFRFLAERTVNGHTYEVYTYLFTYESFPGNMRTTSNWEILVDGIQVNYERDSFIDSDEEAMQEFEKQIKQDMM